MTKTILPLLALTTALLAASGAANAETLTFLGPRGTYSDEAATKAAAADKWDTETAKSITDVAAAVLDGKSDFGLIPIENSSGGFVKETIGLLSKDLPQWRVVGDVAIPIDNTLMARPGTKLEDIKTLLSHPQPFLQSAGYIEKNLSDAKQVETKSTAAAAEAVSKDEKSDEAAIAAPAAAKVYGLDIIAKGIQDDSRNRTRFWIVGKELPGEEAEVDHLVVVHTAEAGTTSLSTLLDKLDAVSMNITDIVSMPTGDLDASRYLITLQGDQPLALRTVTTEIEGGPGETVVLGAYEKSAAE